MERESGSSCPLSIEKTKVEEEEGEKGRSAKEIEYRCSPLRGRRSDRGRYPMRAL